jgi:hypothetical protein
MSVVDGPFIWIASLSALVWMSVLPTMTWGPMATSAVVSNLRLEPE